MRFTVGKLFSILFLLITLMISIGMNVTVFERNSFDDRESDKSQLKNSPTIAATENWNREWGELNNIDNAYGSDIYNKTGDIYITGSTNRSGFENVLLLKYNKTGDLQFNVTRLSCFTCCGLDVAVDQKTGDIYITGYVEQAADTNIIILRYNSTGDLNWSIGLDSTTGLDVGYGIDVDSESNVIVTGRYDDKVITVKFNSTNDQKWLKTYQCGGMDFTFGRGITVGENDNIYVTGKTTNSVSFDDDIFILKYNSTGDYKWVSVIDGSSGGNDAGKSIAVDSQNQIYITGYQATSTGGREVAVYKLIDNGDSVTPASGTSFDYGGTTKAEGEDIFIDKSDNLYIAVYLSNPNNSLVLYKLKNLVDVPYSLLWNGGNTNEKYARSVVVNDSNNFYLIGVNKTGPSDEYDILLLKIHTTTQPIGLLPSAGGDDDDDDDDENIIIPILIGAGVIGAICVAGVAIILIRKRR